MTFAPVRVKWSQEQEPITSCEGRWSCLTSSSLSKLYMSAPFRLRAVSLFSVVGRAKRETRKWPRAWLMVRDKSSLSFFCSRSSKTWDTQVATRVTDGARQERHEKIETTRKARENGLPRSSEFLAWKLKCWQARHVKRDFRVAWTTEVFLLFFLKRSLCSA